MCAYNFPFSLLCSIEAINCHSITYITPYSVIHVPYMCHNKILSPTSYVMYHTYFLATDKLKDAIIAKIAMQAADLYADAYSNMQVGSVKQMWDKVPPSHMILI